MKRIRKQAACFSTALLLAFGSVSSSYASASAIIGGTVSVTAGFAFAWLMTTLGITFLPEALYDSTESVTARGNQEYEHFKEYVRNNIDKYPEMKGTSDTYIDVFMDDVAYKGKVNTASPVWIAFKDYCDSIYTTIENTGSGTSEGAVECDVLTSYFGVPFYIGMTDNLLSALSTSMSNNGYSLSDIMNKYNSYYITWTDGTTVGMPPVTCSFQLHFFNSDRITISDYKIYRNNEFPFYGCSAFYSMSKADYDIKLSEFNDEYFTPPGTSIPRTMYISGNVPIYLDGVAIPLPGAGTDDDAKSYGTSGGISGLHGRDGSLENVDLVGVGAGEGITEVPIDWGKVGEDTDVLLGVGTGEESWASALEQAGVSVVDKSSEMAIDDAGISDIPISDVIAPAVPADPAVPEELEEYTMPGLSDLFPFCIPFDLIDFIGVLAAEPEAPHFTWTFSCPTSEGMKTYDLEIDLSAFDSVAELVRDLECLLFIIGLIMITRDHMIRG